MPNNNSNNNQNNSQFTDLEIVDLNNMPDSVPATRTKAKPTSQQNNLVYSDKEQKTTENIGCFTRLWRWLTSCFNSNSVKEISTPPQTYNTTSLTKNIGKNNNLS